MNDSAVYDLQEYLRILSKYHQNIPLLIPDGIYGSKTKEAVQNFQSSSGLTPTGIVDLLTWNAIYAAYLAALEDTRKSEPIFPFETPLYEGTLSAGDTISLVYILQTMLESIRTLYLGMENTPINGIFGPETETNIKIFQATHGIPVTGTVDKLTWNRLADAYNKTLNRENR